MKMKKQLDIKKLLLLNMPYILMGLFATNFGEGWRMAVGADASAKMLSFFATLPVALATIVGSILGIISGYFGKAYAQIIMRTLDIFYAFPSILLAIALSSVLGSGLSSIIIPIAVILVPPIARVAESTVQDIMPEDFIEAAQTSGASPLKVIVFFIIPNTFGRIFIYCTTQFSVSILSASGLSFLGLGISPPTPEWGSMLNALRQQIYINPLITIIPGLFIFVTALSVNIISDGLKDAMEANS